MAGLWESGTKKQRSSTLWGGDSSDSKSVYESYGGKLAEAANAEEAAKQERDARKKADEEKKKKESEKNGLQKFAEGAGDLGKAIGAGLEQGWAATADVALKGGSLVNEAKVQLEGGTEAEKNKKRQADLQTTEQIRNWIKSGKDIQGNNFQGTSDDIGVNDLGNGQKVARLAGESLNVGLTASSFLNPASLGARATLPKAAETGLSIAKNGTRITGGQAAKEIGKEMALYGGTDAVATGSQVYGETGDPLKASVEGLKAGVGSALLQGAFSGTGYGLGRAKAKRMDAKAGVTDNGVSKVNVSDALVESIRKDKKTLMTFDDGKTAKSKPLSSYLEDIDRRATEVDTPEYQKNNGLMNTEAAQAKYDEIMSDTENIPGMKEATAAVGEADKQLQYYNDLRVKNPLARQVDNIQAKIAKIEDARKQDLENLQNMSQDANSDFHPGAFEGLNKEANAKYDELIKEQQSKIDELYAKDPEGAAEVQMLNDAEKTVQTQRMDAQKALEDTATNQEKIAREEADKIAQTPNEEKVAAHKVYLETKKNQIAKRIEDAKVRAESPNDTLDKTVSELDSIKDGSHPLVVNGASKERIQTKQAELYEENQVNTAEAISKDVGATKRTPTDAEVEDMTTGVVNKYVDEAQLANRPQWNSAFNFLQQPTQYLRRMGLGELSDLRTDAMMEHARFQASVDDKLQAYVKQGRKSNSDAIFKALDGDTAAYENLSAVGQKVVDDMKADYREVGIKLGIPAEYIDKVDYAPHLFTQDANKSELLKLQIELAKQQDAIASSVQATDTTKLKNSIGDAGDGILTADDMTGILDTYKQRFNDNNIELRRGNRRETNVNGNYQPDTDYISLMEGRATKETFNHETVHKAIHQFLDDTQIETLYKDMVKTRGGKDALTKHYQDNGYEGIDWKGAAEEEIANTFNDFLTIRSSMSKTNALDSLAEWAKAKNLPDSVVEIIVTLSRKLDDVTGVTKSKERLNEFYTKLEAGGFHSAERRKTLYGEGSLSEVAVTDGKSLGLAKKRAAELQAKIDALIDPDQKVSFQDFTKVTGNVKNRFLEKRTGAEGYETNPYKAYSAYMDAANRKINFEPFMQQAAIVANTLDANSSMGRFLKEEVRNMSNQKHNWDKFLDDGYNEMLAQHGLDQTKLGELIKNGPTKVMRGFRLTTSMAHLGLSVNTAINTTAQGIFMPASFGIDGTAVGMVQAANLGRKLAASKLTKVEVADWKKMKEMGILEGTSKIIPEAYESPNVGRVSNLGTHAMKGIYAGVIGADRSLRMASYYGAKYIGEQKGLTGKALDRFVYEKVIETNQNFSRYEAPQAWRSHGMKMIGSMVNFVPGAIIRSSEIGVDGIKGAGTIIGKYRGKDITKGEFYDAVRGVTNAVSFTMTAAVAAQAYDSMTGQGEVIPNPFSADFWNNPMLQFWIGNEATGKAGVKDLFPGRGDEFDENGNNVTLQQNRDKFVNDVLPQYFIPGYSQWKRTTNALKINEQGFSETEKGRVRYITDSKNDLQRALTGEYSTPEGRDYINNMGKPGGGSLNGDQSDMVKYGTDTKDQKNMYYDFYKAADKITSRADANAEVTQLYKDGKPEAAKRKATEYNKQVEEKIAEWKNKYDYLDDDVLKKLVGGLRIELTPRSEAARSN